MPRVTAGKRSELESFWRAHLDGWRRSGLNQREYCEAHGLPLKRFGNWRAKFKHEDDVPRQKLLWRRGGGLKHMSKHMLKDIPSAPSSYIPSARSGGSGRRRNFSEGHCQSKFVYFAKTLEPDFAVIDVPAFFRVDLSDSMAAPSIWNFALTTPISARICRHERGTGETKPCPG